MHLGFKKKGGRSKGFVDRIVPNGVHGRSPGRWLGDKVPKKLKNLLITHTCIIIVLTV